MPAFNRLGDLVKSNLEAAISRNEPDAKRAASEGGQASAASSGRQGRSQARRLSLASRAPGQCWRTR